eukprot:CAMPEP_0182857830 /NCGR_PEP_ID=MMETSP0034_2-20130328/3282_1 /TAXON_ID=156128 /ORGANISM="Nephroselmis pyriformis, Strain CCMP717" /LENGTH=190 /DNA_ID=CAMNT_0024989113 /DNA_START=275 /DNA_END=847 /DNA_ORIENTATION=+
MEAGNAAPQPSSAKKPSLVIGRRTKTKANGGSLGVKKLSKVSDDLFKQPNTVAEQPAHTAQQHVAAAAPSAPAQPPAPAPRTGHVSIDKGGMDFFAELSGPATPSRSPPKAKDRAPEPTMQAREKFGNAKNISSDKFFNKHVAEDRPEAHMARMAHLNGATAISSGDYWSAGGKNQKGALDSLFSMFSDD